MNRIDLTGGARGSGSVLVAVLWCLALLFILVVGVLHSSRMDLLVTKNYEDGIQAHYLAVAGIERAKALLYQDAQQRSRSRTSHSSQLYNAPDQFRETSFGRGKFSVLRRGQPEEGGGLVYGITDEESRLNLNLATAEELARLVDITPDVIAAIADWRDGDNAASPGGAELEYYASLSPPCRPRNGPFESVRELLMVRGVNRRALLGRDARMSGLLDAPENSVIESRDLGWSGMLTVHSGVANVNAAGYDRIDIQTAPESELTMLPGVTADLARAIVAYRQRKRFEQIADLLDVTPAQSEADRAAAQVAAPAVRSGPGSTSEPTPDGGGQPDGPSGPKLISSALLMEFADDITVGSAKELPGVINVNTAPMETLATLQGVSRELAQAIVSFRESSGSFASVAWLLKVPGFTPELLKQLGPKLTARSETYRITAEGVVISTGSRKRIQEIVRINLQDVMTLAYREGDL